MKCTVISLIVTAAVATGAQAALGSQGPMQPFPTTDNVPAQGDYSRLSRQGSSITIRVKTTGLDAGSPYTLWAVVFNDPRYCHTSPCTAADLPVVAGHDPRVEASIVYVGGGIADANGSGDFVGRVFATRSGVHAERLFGSGLLAPNRAEIHVLVRGHGYPQEEDFFAAFGTFAGGCNAENAQQPPCEDQQFAIHSGY